MPKNVYKFLSKMKFKGNLEGYFMRGKRSDNKHCLETVA